VSDGPNLYLIAELDANCAVMGAYYCGECLQCQASAEIRRLRAERDHWKSQYASAMKMIDELDIELERFHEDYNLIQLVARYGSHSALVDAWGEDKASIVHAELSEAEKRHRSYQWNQIMRQAKADND